MAPATLSLRCSFSRADLVCSVVKRSRSIMLSRNTITVRAMAPISSDARGGGNSCRHVAVGQPLHHIGQAVERAGDAAADQPAEARPISTAAMPTLAMMVRVRCCDAVSAAAAALV